MAGPSTRFARSGWVTEQAQTRSVNLTVVDNYLGKKSAMMDNKTVFQGRVINNAEFSTSTYNRAWGMAHRAKCGTIFSVTLHGRTPKADSFARRSSRLSVCVSISSSVSAKSSLARARSSKPDLFDSYFNSFSSTSFCL